MTSKNEDALKKLKTDTVNPKREKTRTLEDTTRNVILQDTHRNKLTLAYVTDICTDDDLGETNSMDEMLSPQLEACVPQKMKSSCDELYCPSIESISMIHSTMIP